jgi:hypothetical protein
MTHASGANSNWLRIQAARWERKHRLNPCSWDIILLKQAYASP